MSHRVAVHWTQGPHSTPWVISPTGCILFWTDWSESGRTDDIVTCVAEAVMNAAEHGNGFDPSKTVAIQVHLGHAIMVCRVRDEGAGFDPEACRSAAKAAGGRADDDNDYGRGWGLKLIDELTDYWIATRDQHGFCVEMYFLSHHRKS